MDTTRAMLGLGLGLGLGLVPAGPAAAADCRPSPAMTLGTHYEPDKAVRNQGDIGTGLTLRGRLLSARGCTPLPNAKIIHWQAGNGGRYVDRLRVWRLADAQGGYRFETEWPNMRGPHIHFIVEAEGHHPLATIWVPGQRVDAANFDIVLEPLR